MIWLKKTTVALRFEALRFARENYLEIFSFGQI